MRLTIEVVDIRVIKLVYLLFTFLSYEGPFYIFRILDFFGLFWFRGSSISYINIYLFLCGGSEVFIIGYRYVEIREEAIDSFVVFFYRDLYTSSLERVIFFRVVVSK